MKRNREVVNCPTGSSSSSCPTYAEKGKMWVEDSRQDADMDELLAVLGYKVKSSDMVDVARNLEHLDNLMVQNDISHLSDNDNVHYNPSDLSGWLQNMLVEFKNPNQSSASSNLDFGSTNGVICFSNDQESGLDSFDDDLRAIPGNVVLGRGSFEELEDGLEGNRKKIKSFSVQESTAGQPVVVVDTQEAGVRLVHTLMACAEAVEGNDLSLGDALVKHIRVLAEGSGVGAMRKVAGYFAEGLARRIYKISPRDLLESCYSDLLENHFYESCPYLKFAHFTANQAILEAFSGAKKVHVIDFSLKQGMQWPALLQALALRPGGPPAFRLTGVGPPQPDNTDSLQQVGWKLAQLAETIGVEFEFKGFVANSLADLDASILDIRSSDVESVAVNSVFEMHKLLARPNAFEKVLNSIKSMKPKIVTIVEQEGNHNGSVFLERFNEALHYYSTMFDSLEGGYELTQPNNEDLLMSERYLGRQICNVVACEGMERVERHETLTQWRARMGTGGFEPVHLGSNAFKQASMLLALFGGDGYRVEENGGCLMLGWHTRPLIATSAWRLLPGEFE